MGLQGFVDTYVWLTFEDVSKGLCMWSCVIINHHSLRYRTVQVNVRYVLAWMTWKKMILWFYKACRWAIRAHCRNTAAQHGNHEKAAPSVIRNGSFKAREPLWIQCYWVISRVMVLSCSLFFPVYCICYAVLASSMLCLLLPVLWCWTCSLCPCLLSSGLSSGFLI